MNKPTVLFNMLDKASIAEDYCLNFLAKVVNISETKINPQKKTTKKHTHIKTEVRQCIFGNAKQKHHWPVHKIKLHISSANS